MSNFKDVQALHLDKFGLTPNKSVITHEEKLARADFLQEELDELRVAIDSCNTLDEIDALIDLAYVAMGTAALMGVNWENHWDTVHKANMQKQSGFNATRPNMPRDLHKPRGWVGPNHYEALRVKPKIMIIGHAQHGKDTVASMLEEEFSYSHISGSWIACQQIIFPQMSKRYSNDHECYIDRVNNREVWFNLIARYNDPDKARLGKLIYEKSDVYCGVRDASELWAINSLDLYDLCIWVDASKRMPKESPLSINVTEHMADVVVDNNGTEEQLLSNLRKVLESRGYA